MEEKYWFLLIGVMLGWLTKIPFVYKWYKEYKVYKQKKIEMYNRIVNMIHGLPKDEQSKHTITAAYFRDTD